MSGLDEDEDSGEGGLYLGFDFSTQQLKVVALDADAKVVAEERVRFDSDLPEYRTQDGVHRRAAGVVTSPTIMWVKALDILMEKVRIVGVDFADVRAVSGCGQQHGSVFWRSGASSMLAKANPEKFLHDELAHAFSVLDSPVWMDNSTGSRAYERFTGPQLAKLAEERPEAWANTERISLVSSFAASLFLGRYAPIDFADGGGMNLMDLRARDWSEQCLQATGPDLRDKLGPLVSPSTVLGSVSEYMVERYGFDPDCQVVAFTGDNPASLAGLKMRSGDIGLSLGTSDTLFLWLEDEDGENAEEESIRPGKLGHIWPNPVDDDAYMALLCYKNGSLTRERVCRDAAEGDWDIFNQLLDSTPRGNFGNVGFYFDQPEICPPGVVGDFRFNKSGERATRFASAEAEVRALVEGQAMAKRLHAGNLGVTFGSGRRVLACGGASANKAILQVYADIFNAPVFAKEMGPNTAAMGGALRALRLCGGEGGRHTSESDDHEGIAPVCTPHKDAASVYKTLMERYAELEARIVENSAASATSA